MVRSFLLRLALTAVYAVLASCPLPKQVGADCPAICVRVNSLAPVCSTAPSLTFDFHHPYVQAAYHLGMGVMAVVSYEPAELECTLTVEDDWQVVGPVPGTPIDFMARFAVKLWANPDEHVGGVIAMLREGAANVDSVSAWAPDGWVDTLTVPLHVLAGEPFRMVHHLGIITTGAYQENWATGQMLFLGLPEGAGVRSCQGVDWVPTLTTTWGALKARYR